MTLDLYKNNNKAFKFVLQLISHNSKLTVLFIKKNISHLNLTMTKQTETILDDIFSWKNIIYLRIKYNILIICRALNHTKGIISINKKKKILFYPNFRGNVGDVPVHARAIQLGWSKLQHVFHVLNDHQSRRFVKKTCIHMYVCVCVYVCVFSIF